MSLNMSSRNDKKDRTTSNLSNVREPYNSKSTSVPYPSPPSSPPQTKAEAPEVLSVPGETVRPARASASAPLSLPTSPSRYSPAPKVDQKKLAGNSLDVSTLSTSLGLSKQCGGLTAFLKPCRQRSPAANSAKIVTQLKSMTNLTQCSKELEPALGELVKLVHCRYHRSGNAKKSRIDAWTLEFPAGEKVANPAVMTKKQIRGLLELRSPKCIEDADGEHERCKNSIGGQRVHNCAETINEIIKSEVYLDDDYLEFFLKVLETNKRCPQHIDKQPLKRVAEWKLRIIKLREEHIQHVKSVEYSTRSELAHSSLDSDTQDSESTLAKANCRIILRRGRLPTPDFDLQALSQYWPPAYDISPFNIVAGNNRGASRDVSYHKVRAAIEREFCQRGLNPGYVYVYEVEGNRGFVKIGYTTRSVEERHQEWDFDCNRAPKILYPIPSATVAKVGHARRVEALCHAELDHLKITIYCNSCLKEHLEWFEVSPAEAIAAIQKWSTWMATNPYHRTYELRSKNKWALKEEEGKRIIDMSRFMTELSGAAEPAVIVDPKLDEAKAGVVVVSST